MNPDAKKCGDIALLAGSTGFGMMVTSRLAPEIGWFMAILAGACVAEATFVVIGSTIELFTRRGGV
jgi:hypothetical protein